MLNADYDLVVVGGGIAGCAAALSAARKSAKVALVTKRSDPRDSNTWFAQGGIIYTGPGDSPELLVRDVLTAGAGASCRRAAELLATEGPKLVRDLLIDELQVDFDRTRSGGSPHVTREGAHSVARVIHHKDFTGQAIQRAMTRAVEAEPNVEPVYGGEALQLAMAEGRCVGVHVSNNGHIETLLSRGVVLATGGLCALYEHTTNPPYTTGDGIALALEAGADVRSLHYVQFHPTALVLPDGGRFLISESLRGEGAILRDSKGREFVRHPQGSLAPRDVVAREIREMMRRTGAPCAYLDVSHLSGEWLSNRFPTIYRRCKQAGINVPDEPIPVVPAAHYSCGGVATDEDGRTSVPGLYAAGEVACTGLHGANRLASTSLLEGLVWGWRAGRSAVRPGVVPRPRARPEFDLTSLVGREDTTSQPLRVGEESGQARRPAPTTLQAGRARVEVAGADIPVREHRATSGTESSDPTPEDTWKHLGQVMWERAGLVRTGQGLAQGLEELRELELASNGAAGIEALRLRRALIVARTLIESALVDTTSRGCHYRIDQEVAEDADISG